MKVFGFMIAFYILFLSVQPGLSDMISLTSQSVETCCGGSCQPFEREDPTKEPERKGCDENSNCNPFQTCKGCPAFTSDFTYQNFLLVPLFSKQRIGTNDRVPPRITLDFWQPPKIV